MMEFNEKLQQLRKQKGITQEELAQVLFVSRAAVSKWESGRGWPNIDSLKAIARFYGITIDELLSGDELLDIAQEDTRQKERHTRDLVFGLLDCGSAMLFFLPFFGSRGTDQVEAVNLLSLTAVSPWLLGAYYLAVIAMTGVGLLTLAGRSAPWQVKNRYLLSGVVNAVAVLIFTVSLQPYAAAFLFLFLAIKVLMLVKWQ